MTFKLNFTRITREAALMQIMAELGTSAFDISEGTQLVGGKWIRGYADGKGYSSKYFI